jgi:ArsR family transcriptional regulator
MPNGIYSFLEIYVGNGMKDFIKVMKALSDANRVKIIKMLQHKTMCVCEIREALQVSQPSASKNLKILEDAGLVEFKKDGLWVNYHLTDGSRSPYIASLLGNLRHWLEDEAEVEDLIEKLPSIRREEICRK